MKKINRKMQTCKAVADGASEVLDGLAKQGVIDSYIVSCCTTTPTADGGTDYDSGSTTYGNHHGDYGNCQADEERGGIQCQAVRRASGSVWMERVSRTKNRPRWRHSIKTCRRSFVCFGICNETNWLFTRRNITR